MTKKTTSIVLVVLLINFASGAEIWYKNRGVASIACPINDDPDNPTVLPYQGDCTKFIKCSYGLAYTLSCPKNLEWSSTLLRCESPFIANCNSKATTAKPITGGDGCNFKYAAHPTDCRKALQCVNGQVFEMDCPDGSSWSKTNNQCIFGDNDC